MHYEDEFSFCRSQMGPDERILWKGKPATGNLFCVSDIFSTLFAIFWLGFAIFWTYMAFQGGGIFFLFGVPFIAVGVYLLFGRFFQLSHLRKNSFYVITNKKIIRRVGSKVDSLSAASLPSFRTVMYKDGNGTILFDIADPYRNGRYRSGTSTYPTAAFSLENLPDISLALQAIEQMDR